MGSIDWRQLVEEHTAWEAYNFPNDTSGIPARGSVFGVIEELGELIHAHLKEDQGIRGSAQKHQEAAQDAIGDLTVYLLGVMHHYRTRPNGDRPWPEEEPNADDALLNLAWGVGSLAHGHLWESTPLGTVGHIVFHLRRYCYARGWDYEDIVARTWNSVKQRDWIKYPHTGLPQESNV